jgi:hypothetical protein
MKKLSLALFATIVAVAIFSCSPKKGSTIESDPHVLGYTVDSSANINTVLATIDDMAIYDSVSYKSKYVDTAFFNDNLSEMTIKENVSLITKIKNLGVVLKLVKINAIWETNRNTPLRNSQNFVHSIYTISYTRDGKTVNNVVSQIDAFNKEGKIIEEWLFYDSSELKELMK